MRVPFSIVSLFLIVAVTWTSLSWSSQEYRDFTDPNGKFVLTLQADWLPVTYQDGAGNTVVEFIFENREKGLLRIRRKSLAQDMEAKEFAQRDQKISLRFRPGFKPGKLEPFTNRTYPAVALSFDFTYGRRPKTARYYYLKTDEHTFYVLQFEGSPEVLRTMRNRTDLMARHFRLLP